MFNTIRENYVYLSDYNKIHILVHYILKDTTCVNVQSKKLKYPSTRGFKLDYLNKTLFYFFERQIILDVYHISRIYSILFLRDILNK